MKKTTTFLATILIAVGTYAQIDLLESKKVRK